tara:strand:- start:411 stop:725 length:315 start_codon:yes stop_codon:yes gene_type:complete
MECPICFEPMDIFITLGCCKKDIHFDCFLKCLKENESCPFCRKQYNNPFNEYKNQTIVQIIDTPYVRQNRTLQEVYIIYNKLLCVGVMIFFIGIFVILYINNIF